ncbi:MAG: hypothetical protein ACFFF4_11240 [Candidatus Thorarchaeota archaeon]
MKKMPQFALKVEGETVFRSDDAEAILQEMTRRIELESEAFGDSSMVNERIFSDMVYIAGQIVDCIYHEIPTVSRTEMHLEGRDTPIETQEYPVRNVIIKIEGSDLSNIQTRVEEELELREFMYHDVIFEVFELVHNGTPSVVIQIIPRLHIPLVTKGQHSEKMPPETKDQIIQELRRNSKHTYTKTVIQRFLNRRCKCEYLRHAADLVELVLTQEGFSDIELKAAEMCLEYLNDIREGQSLLSLWQKRDAIRARWKKRDIPSKTFISQTYEWFSQIRNLQCHEISSAIRPLLSVDKKEVSVPEVNQFN